MPSSSCSMPCGYANCSALAHRFHFYPFLACDAVSWHSHSVRILLAFYGWLNHQTKFSRPISPKKSMFIYSAGDLLILVDMFFLMTAWCPFHQWTLLQDPFSWLHQSWKPRLCGLVQTRLCFFFSPNTKLVSHHWVSTKIGTTHKTIMGELCLMDPMGWVGGSSHMHWEVGGFIQRESHPKKYSMILSTLFISRISIYIYIHMYIYVEREIEGEREREIDGLSPQWLRGSKSQACAKSSVENRSDLAEKLLRCARSRGLNHQNMGKSGETLKNEQLEKRYKWCLICVWSPNLWIKPVMPVASEKQKVGWLFFPYEMRIWSAVLVMSFQWVEEFTSLMVLLLPIKCKQMLFLFSR